MKKTLRQQIDELAAMDVPVTAGATALQAEVGAPEIDLAGEERRRVGDRLLAVAAPAGERRVRALQRVARERVVERPLAALAPVDEVEVAPLVLDVTALALGVVGPRMQALAGRDALRERRMAGEAALAIDAVLGAVAREAAIAAVEMGVRPGELARRDLGARRGTGEPRTAGAEGGRGQAAQSGATAGQWPILA